MVFCDRRPALAAALMMTAAALAGCSAKKAEAPVQPHVVAANDLEAGRYLVMVGGCNDCHTPGYPQSGGKTPEAEQMQGNPTGSHGPWGTSYPANLRLLTQATTEDGWVQLLRTKRSLPPMPSHNISRMNEVDLRNLYRYIHSLGAAGAPEPESLPPGQTPAGPYENMIPVMPGAKAP